VNGAVAVVTYTFEIEYEIAGQIVRESGHDLLVLRQSHDTWRAVWRALLPDSPAAF
jgi:hypothetical protein